MSETRLRQLERASAASPGDRVAHDRFFAYARSLGCTTPCQGLSHVDGPWSAPFEFRGRIMLTRKCTRCEFLSAVKEWHPPLTLEGLIRDESTSLESWGGVRDRDRAPRPSLDVSAWITYGAWNPERTKLAADLEQHDRLAEFGNYKMPERRDDG